MKHLILGTAGHVDHGKTALVRALTGVDTDRLEEEKKRGITIVLGFAEMELPGGIQVGIVDVPGHERFVNQMLAGVGGVDMIMLVVAADEGVMPQTREHFDICRLLNVRKGLTVITKTDLVDTEWLALVQQDVEGLIEGTFLEGRPVCPVSAKTGDGMGALKKSLAEIAGEVEDRDSRGILRLPVDRVFTMKGFGTVITGTLLSGNVKNGEAVEILPGGLQARVRGMQVHSKSVEEALAGQRTALNLQGVEKESIRRGDTVTVPGLLTPTYMVDAVVTLLPDVEKPLKNRSLIRFYIGASRGVGNIVHLDREQLMPEEQGYAQIRLREPVVAMGGDRFILRSVSENRTIGGGEILDPQPRKHKTSDPSVVPSLEVLKEGSPEEKAVVFLRHAGFSGMDLAGFRCRLPLAKGTAKKILQRLRERGEAVTLLADTLHLLHMDHLKKIEKKTLSVLTGYHRSKPLEPGIPKAELASRLSTMIGEKVFPSILNHLSRGGKVIVEENRVRLPEHKVCLTSEEEEAARKIEALYKEAGLAPPYSRKLSGELGLEESLVAEILRHLVERKSLTHIQGDLFMDTKALEAGREKVRAVLEGEGEISVAGMRELLGLTRKYLIPLLEYFDGIGFTARKGDVRVLR
ncbi:MAG: selenocysteine-specific translation elongation factor [Deltaproteobacteria bacterium]|nr:selenocysteine-specific translation elongation factor [Deltaproteobacteria bacterium]